MINKMINKINKLNFSLFFLLTIITTSIFAEDFSKIDKIDTPQGTAETNGDQQGTSGVDAGATAKSVALANISIMNQNSKNNENKDKNIKQQVRSKKITGKTKKTTVNHAGTKEIPIADNEQIKVVLSNRDINRISVIGDKIKTIHGPTGLYTAKNDPSDPSGSAYISIYSNKSFAIFLATVKGHNFSLLVTSKAAPGKTVILEPTNPSPFSSSIDRLAETDSYQKTLIALISSMINLEPSEDYAYVSASRAKKYKWISSTRRKNFYNIAYIKPVAFYRGENLLGIISAVKNRTRNPLTLKPSYFYQPGVKAVALSQEVIPPLGTCWLYRIVSWN